MDVELCGYALALVGCEKESARARCPVLTQECVCVCVCVCGAQGAGVHAAAAAGRVPRAAARG
eukprot:988725-Rhodomonas_salina.1